MSDSVKGNLLAAFRYLLKPLVRLAMKNGVSYAEFREALKEAYVDVTSAQAKVSGDEPTEERISLMTSISAPEVSRILQSDSGTEFASAVQRELPLPNLLTAWHTDPVYAGPYGVCRDLKFDPADPSDPRREEFASLAADTCPGIDAGVLLDELIRTGCVVSAGSNYYRAAKRSYVPEPLSAVSILLFAKVVHNFCETAELNLRAPDARRSPVMQRIVFTRYGITKSDLVEFDKYIRIRGQAFSDDVDNWLSDRDSPDADRRVNTGIGIYQYIVNEEDDSTISQQLPNRRE
jgi:hypothetical protein